MPCRYAALVLAIRLYAGTMRHTRVQHGSAFMDDDVGATARNHKMIYTNIAVPATATQI